MHNTTAGEGAKKRLASILAVSSGVAGFLASLGLALQLFWLQGNPAFFIIWLIAAFATAAGMQFHRQWRTSFHRIWTMKTPAQAQQKKWNGEAEEVAFRDMPTTP